MPVLKPLDKIVKKIEHWQESCASLQRGLRTLLSENVSIADISVNPSAFEKKKKEIKTEATIGVDPRTGVASVANGTRITKLPREKSQEINALKKKGDEVIVAGDEEPEKEEVKSIKYTVPSPVKIIKTMSILKTDRKLSDIIKKFFEYRLSGNNGKAEDMREFIDRYITDRDLDPITVYASYDMNMDKETEEPEEPEETEDSIQKDNSEDKE